MGITLWGLVSCCSEANLQTKLRGKVIQCFRAYPCSGLKFAGGSVASRPVPSSRALGLGSQPLTCKAVIEPLEGTLWFLKPFGRRGPEGESDTRGHGARYWHGQESPFSHCATCGKGSAGPPSPEVTLGGLSSAPNPELPSQSPSTAPFGGGGGRGGG